MTLDIKVISVDIAIYAHLADKSSQQLASQY
jgi:hypothetical protein